MYFTTTIYKKSYICTAPPPSLHRRAYLHLLLVAGMYSVLDQKLFDTYIELKCEPIIAIIEPNMYMGKFDWAKCVRPTGARQGGHIYTQIYIDAGLILRVIIFYSSLLTRQRRDQEIWTQLKNWFYVVWLERPGLR